MLDQPWYPLPLWTTVPCLELFDHLPFRMSISNLAQSTQTVETSMEYSQEFWFHSSDSLGGYIHLNLLSDECWLMYTE
jgi:hypothetical protein